MINTSKKLLISILLIALTSGCIDSLPTSNLGFSASTSKSEQILKNAFNNQRSDLQVEGQGIVIQLLSDDLDGSRHQRFIVRLSSGQTLLIAHNIDIAPRIDSLQKGDTIAFYGEYEWNSQGGVIHWTHRDPHRKHTDGWIEHKGKKYQ